MSNPKSQFNPAISSGKIPRKGSPAGEEFGPPAESAIWPEDNSGMYDREAEFEHDLSKKSRKET